MKYVLATLVTLCALACSAEPAPPESASAPGPAEQWLSQVEAAHAQADRADREAARALLESARDKPIPGQVSGADRRRVLQDIQFRLALLALERADAALAVREAERGLALGQSDDEFSANLWIVRGRADAAQGRRHEAASAYAAALSIHERLLDRALKGKP
jgi:tetratricopeptide (TPR) repeat protein